MIITIIKSSRRVGRGGVERGGEVGMACQCIEGTGKGRGKGRGEKRAL